MFIASRSSRLVLRAPPPVARGAPRLAPARVARRGRRDLSSATTDSPPQPPAAAAARPPQPGFWDQHRGKILMALVLGSVVSSNLEEAKHELRATPTIPMVRLEGVIQAGAGLRSVNLKNSGAAIEQAFRMRRAVAVLVVINSPGGSAVQAQMIAERLAALSKEKKIPVIAYVEDMAASGGYMIALGAEEIVCNPFSLVGSVGVITAGFGLDKLIDKLGVERRVYTAGTHKSKLDPFRPEEPGDVEFVKGMLHDMHVLFIDMVKERRGAKLRPDLGDLFNGDVWPARKAMELGLVDQVGDIRGVLKARFGDKARIVQVGPQSFADLLADSMPSSRLGLEGLVSAIGGGWGISASSSIGGGGGGYVS